MRFLAGVLFVTVLVLVLGAAHPAWACTNLQIESGTCPSGVTSKTTGNEAILSGREMSPGTQGGLNSGHHSGGVPDQGKFGFSTPRVLLPPVGPVPITPNPRGECLFQDAIFCVLPDDAQPATPATPGTPAVTLSDIALFRPQAAVQSMQPEGWMVVGLPTNFFAVIEPHAVDGELLGRSAQVRFTPLAYTWTYGDGDHARLDTKGASWEALGLREFDATATSHVYDAPGTYTIELLVDYGAEYRLNGGAWKPISGTVALSANDLVAIAGAATTVLVDRDCVSNPRGPGC